MYVNVDSSVLKFFISNRFEEEFKMSKVLTLISCSVIGLPFCYVFWVGMCIYFAFEVKLTREKNILGMKVDWFNSEMDYYDN